MERKREHVLLFVKLYAAAKNVMIILSQTRGSAMLKIAVPTLIVQGTRHARAIYAWTWTCRLPAALLTVSCRNGQVGRPAQVIAMERKRERVMLCVKLNAAAKNVMILIS
jgi:hypothetical protein